MDPSEMAAQVARPAAGEAPRANETTIGGA